MSRVDGGATFLDRMAARASGRQPLVTLRRRSRFEPGTAEAIGTDTRLGVGPPQRSRAGGPAEPGRPQAPIVPSRQAPIVPSPQAPIVPGPEIPIVPGPAVAARDPAAPDRGSATEPAAGNAEKLSETSPVPVPAPVAVPAAAAVPAPSVTSPNPRERGDDERRDRTPADDASLRGRAQPERPPAIRRPDPPMHHRRAPRRAGPTPAPEPARLDPLEVVRERVVPVLVERGLLPAAEPVQVLPREAAPARDNDMAMVSVDDQAVQLPASAGAGAEIHVHLDRVEVHPAAAARRPARPAPPAPVPARPPAGRTTAGDLDAYLTRRRGMG